MKLDVTSKLLSSDKKPLRQQVLKRDDLGNPVLNEDKTGYVIAGFEDVTVRDILITCLLEKKDGLKAEDKLKRYKMADLIATNDSIELTTNDASFLCQLTEDQDTLIYGQIAILLGN